jgi:tRNA threonylcarbamoyladenosine biosynthesis protein TsaB
MSGPVLVLDTATRTPLLALAQRDGELIAEREWASRQRHGEELLERLDELLGKVGAGRDDFAAVIAGTGPGSFTGLRIGLATAKVIAYSLQIPLVGVSTTRALGLAAWSAGAGPATFAVALPAGVADRYVHLVRVDAGAAHELEPPRLVAGDEALVVAGKGADLVAIDLDDAQLPVAALERGRAAIARLPAALALLGAHQLAGGEISDPALLVPAYVALPRGLGEIRGEIEWSVDRP